MKTRTVTKTSVFPSGRAAVFEKLQEIKTLQHIAFPYATFKAVNGQDDLVWQSGQTFKFNFRLFGVIPFGVHTIRVIEFDEEKGIYTEEGNRHVPVWNHRIMLEELADGKLRYTDKVEISAGRKTPFVCLWASMFYSHRQRRWKKLLQQIRLGKRN